VLASQAARRPSRLERRCRVAAIGFRAATAGGRDDAFNGGAYHERAVREVTR